MGVLFATFKHRPADTTGSYKYFYDFTSISSKRGMKSKTNSLQIEWSNKFSKYSGNNPSVFEGLREEDDIFVYSNWGSITEATDISFTGNVKEWSFKESGGKKIINITCTDRTYDMLNKIYLGGGFDVIDGTNASEGIIKIVNWVSSLEGRTGKIDTSNVQTTPTGGTAFDNVDLHLHNKNAYEWVSELSVDPYTRYDVGGKSDRTYIFWINSSNELYWIYPSQTSSGTLNLSNLQVEEVSLKKTVYDVVNMIIFNAGKDPSGKGIEWYYYDVTSKQPDLRVKVQSMVDIARDLQKAQEDKAAFTSGYPSSYPFTTTWEEVVANDAAYLGTVGIANEDGTGFRGACVRKAKARAKGITQQSGNLRWKGNIRIRGTNSYSPGDLLTVTYNSAGLLNKKLRVQSVQQQIRKDGWSTTTELEEDEKAIKW